MLTMVRWPRQSCILSLSNRKLKWLRLPYDEIIFRWCFAHFIISDIIGYNVLLYSVISYSISTGISSYTVRDTSLFCSISLNSFDSILNVMPGIELAISRYRLWPLLNETMISIFHLPLITYKVSCIYFISAWQSSLLLQLYFSLIVIVLYLSKLLTNI